MVTHRFARALPGALLSVLLLLMSAGSAGAIEADDASRFIDDLARDAISALRDEELTPEGREQRFEELFRRGFAIPTIGRFVLGRYWRQASEAQQERFLELFQNVVVDTYARRFREYSGETLQITGTRPVGDGGDVMVESEVVGPAGGRPVPVRWRVRAIDGEPQIVDVMIEGVSMAVTQRDEYNSIIQTRGGIDALLARMQSQVQAG